MQRIERPRHRVEPRSATSGQGRSPLWRALPLLFVAASALWSCGDWVSVGPFVRCGGDCEPTGGLQCERAGYKYDRSGRCVCADDVNCTNYPCELPDDPKCFIAGYDVNGACVCVAELSPGTCGQPCFPQKLVKESCNTKIFEFNAKGECACGRAACPCGQVCSAESPDTTCALLRQYNANGDCACAPVVCPGCAEKPCCSQLCGAECLIPGCTDDGSGSCEGFCSKTNECVKGPQPCNEVP